MFIHVVKSGENLYSISKLYNVSPQQIIIDNELKNPNRLVIGQTLVIINEKSNPTKEIIINGYTYPSIKKDVLNKTLPYLTYITPFSYGFTSDGNLVMLDDKTVLEEAKKDNVSALMLLTTLGEDGTYSSKRAAKMLQDDELQNILINNIIDTIQEKGYSGLDIDFEYLSKDDNENFSNFVKKLSYKLNSLGYTLTVAVAPKPSDDEIGLIYEGHNYEKLGEYADLVLLMTYEWGYAYGPPMAVSPLNKVEAVVKYAVSLINNNKLLIGIPNYGYDWTLPYIKGKSKAKSISNTDAVALAGDVGAVIEFDETAQTPFFKYYDVDGNEHVVWFEDARSIKAKLDLIEKYNLRGAAYWTIMNYFAQNWLLVSNLFEIVKY